jgi:hypothetical protein
MSGQHAQFEEESRGEPSSQMGYSPRDELPLLSYNRVDLPDQKLRAWSLGAATSTPHYLERVRERVRAVLALLSLIFGFVLVLVVIYYKLASFIDFIFVVLFAILALCINLIFAYGRSASPREASKPED